MKIDQIKKIYADALPPVVTLTPLETEEYEAVLVKIVNAASVREETVTATLRKNVADKLRSEGFYLAPLKAGRGPGYGPGIFSYQISGWV